MSSAAQPRGDQPPPPRPEDRRPKPYRPGTIGHWMWEGLRLFVEEHDR